MKQIILLACTFFLMSCLAKQVEPFQMGVKHDASTMDLVFSRDYSQAHLNANPKQVVNKIIVRLESKSTDKSLESEPDAYGWVYAKLKNLPSWYMQILRCSKLSKTGEYHCYADSDGGGFDLRVGNDHQLLLVDKDRVRMEKCGIVWEGSNDRDSTGALSEYDSEMFVLSQSSELGLNEMSHNSKCDTVESIKKSKYQER